MCASHGIRELFKVCKGVWNNKMNDLRFKYVATWSSPDWIQVDLLGDYCHNFEHENKVTRTGLDLVNVKKADRIERFKRPNLHN